MKAQTKQIKKSSLVLFTALYLGFAINSVGCGNSMEAAKSASELAAAASCGTGDIYDIRYDNDSFSATDSLAQTIFRVDLNTGKAQVSGEIICSNFTLSQARLNAFRAQTQDIRICPAESVVKSNESFATNVNNSDRPSAEVTNWSAIRAQIEGVISDMKAAGCDSSNPQVPTLPGVQF